MRAKALFFAIVFFFVFQVCLLVQCWFVFRLRLYSSLGVTMRHYASLNVTELIIRPKGLSEHSLSNRSKIVYKNLGSTDWLNYAFGWLENFVMYQCCRFE